MKTNDIDPLQAELNKTLPLFARKLKINHGSPTQFAIPDSSMAV
jgi:hypothetical protein